VTGLISDRLVRELIAVTGRPMSRPTDLNVGLVQPPKLAGLQPSPCHAFCRGLFVSPGTGIAIAGILNFALKPLQRKANFGTLAPSRPHRLSSTPCD
jgi:hypothetical protein